MRSKDLTRFLNTLDAIARVVIAMCQLLREEILRLRSKAS